MTTSFPLCTLEAAGSNYLHTLFIVSLSSLVFWRLLWQKNAETTGGAKKTDLAGEEPVNWSGVFPSLVRSSQPLSRKYPARLRRCRWNRILSVLSLSPEWTGITSKTSCFPFLEWLSLNTGMIGLLLLIFTDSEFQSLVNISWKETQSTNKFA